MNLKGGYSAGLTFPSYIQLQRYRYGIDKVQSLPKAKFPGKQNSQKS